MSVKLVDIGYMRKFCGLLFTLLLVLAGTSFFPQKVNAAECGAPIPNAPTKVTAVSGPGAGQITLYWDEAAYANRYAVAYGLGSGKYIYGADNIGGKESRSYTVKALQPGVRYFFKLAAARDCSSSPFSAEVSAVAGGGVATITPVTSVTPVTSIGTPQASVPAKAWVGGGSVGKQKLVATSGPAVGTVTLSWQHADNADNYHLMYGTTAGKYQYGALKIGKVTGFTVRYLAPGTTYYFALVPLIGDRPLYTTDAVSATAYQPVEVVVTSRENLIEPPPPPPITSVSPEDDNSRPVQE